MTDFGIKILQSLFSGRLKNRTNSVLQSYLDPEREFRQQVEAQLSSWKKGNKSSCHIGSTAWGFPITIPWTQLLRHGLIIGATGSGKSYAALLLLTDMLNRFEKGLGIPMGFLDGKGEIARLSLDYLYAYMHCLSDKQQQRLRAKVFVMDFGQTEAVTPYNLLASQDIPPEILVANRIEAIAQLHQGPATLTTRMQSLLKNMLLLMTEQKLPLTLFEKLCMNPGSVKHLVEKSQNKNLHDYFHSPRFQAELKSSAIPLCQRIESLFVSASIRLSMSAQTAPDFRKLQDEGYLIIINVSGADISRSASEFLLRVILSDLKQSVFRRQHPEQKYLWFLDEAQVLYRDAASRENLNDMLTMSRNFGSFFVQMTQSLSSAIRDPHTINTVIQNVGWVMVFRSVLREASILTPAMPVTGSMLSSKRNPYEKQKILTKEQEIKTRLAQIAHFPQRTAYLWLRSTLPSAVKMQTAELSSPEAIAGCTKQEFLKLKKDISFDNLVPRQEIEKALQEAETRLGNSSRPGKVNAKQRDESTSDSDDFMATLKQTYLRKRGEQSTDEAAEG